MDKKEYLLKILTQLEPVWNLAKGLKILVKQGKFDNNMLDTLIDAVQGAVNSANTDLAKQKLQKGLDAMKKMKEMEIESRMQDEKDLKELDRMLDDI